MMIIFIVIFAFKLKHLTLNQIVGIALSGGFI